MHCSCVVLELEGWHTEPDSAGVFTSQWHSKVPHSHVQLQHCDC